MTLADSAPHTTASEGTLVRTPELDANPAIPRRHFSPPRQARIIHGERPAQCHLSGTTMNNPGKAIKAAAKSGKLRTLSESANLREQPAMYGNFSVCALASAMIRNPLLNPAELRVHVI
jgi:hypothetical protein